MDVAEKHPLEEYVSHTKMLLTNHSCRIIWTLCPVPDLAIVEHAKGYLAQYGHWRAQGASAEIVIEVYASHFCWNHLIITRNGSEMR